MKPMPTTSATPTTPDSLAVTENGLFFIVGCGRSGTTLLQVMLDCHPDVTLPNETHFFSDFYRLYHHRYGELADAATMQRALNHLLEWEHIKPLGLDESRVRELVGDANPSWETLFLALLTAFRETRSVGRVGEKTPAHINYLKRLYENYPNAKFIHIIRDPRAVVTSYLRAPFYTIFGKNPYHAINSWRNAIDIHREADAALSPKRYTSVRYEDLVSNPREELERLCSFLELPFDPRMLEFHQREHSGFLAGESHKLGTLKPVYKGSTEAWRKQLSRRNLWLTESALAKQMRMTGYPAEIGSSTALARLQVAYLFIEYKVRVRVRGVLRMAGLLKDGDLGGIADTSPSS